MNIRRNPRRRQTVLERLGERLVQAGRDSGLADEALQRARERLFGATARPEHLLTPFAPAGP
jgi:hypothetical protein